MEYERPAWYAGHENRPPTADQVKAMAHPAAKGVAQRLQNFMGGDQPKRYFSYTALTRNAEDWGDMPPDWSLQPYIDTLVDVGVMARRTTADGNGFYYVPTHHTWPWVQVTLAEHKES